MRWLAGTALLALFAVAPSLSATRPSLHVTPGVVAPGAQIHVTGNAHGCLRGDVVSVLSRAFPGHGFAGLGVISARVRAGGAFSATGRVRRKAPPRRYTVTARCGGGNLGVTAHLRVT